jgi:hypothetical protein
MPAFIAGTPFDFFQHYGGFPSLPESPFNPLFQLLPV